MHVIHLCFFRGFMISFVKGFVMGNDFGIQRSMSSDHGSISSSGQNYHFSTPCANAINEQPILARDITPFSIPKTLPKNLYLQSRLICNANQGLVSLSRCLSATSRNLWSKSMPTACACASSYPGGGSSGAVKLGGEVSVRFCNASAAPLSLA